MMDAVLTREDVQREFTEKMALIEEQEAEQAEVVEAERKAQAAQQELDARQQALEAKYNTRKTFQVDHVQRTHDRLTEAFDDINEWNSEVVAWMLTGEELMKRRAGLGYDAALASFCQAFLTHPGWRNVFDTDEDAFAYFAEIFAELTSDVAVLATPKICAEDLSDSSSVVEKCVDNVWRNIEQKVRGASYGKWDIIKRRPYGTAIVRPEVEAPEEPATEAVFTTMDGTPF